MTVSRIVPGHRDIASSVSDAGRAARPQAPGTGSGERAARLPVPPRTTGPGGRPNSGPSPQGDEFIRGLLDRYGKDMRNYARRLCAGNPDRAEDLVQETLLRAWKHAGTCRTGERPWIMTILKNTAIDGNRAEWSRPRTAGPGELGRIPVPNTEDRIVEAAMLKQALACLPAEHRDVIALVYYQGTSVKETARQLGIAEGTVKSRLHYARQHLRQVLEGQGITGVAALVRAGAVRPAPAIEESVRC